MAERISPDFIWDWPYLQYIQGHLQQVTDGAIKKLMIFCPPRHGKPIDVNARILMGDGSRKRLADIQAGDAVISHTGAARRVLAVFEQGVLPVLLQAWDTASSALGDWSVCITGGILGNEVYILDVFRARLETPDLLRAVKEQGVKWAPRMILVEDAASGVAVQQMLRRETRLPVLPVPPYKGGKLSHAQANTPYVEGGRVVFCPGRWLTDFEHELLAFPAGTHDDQVDAFNILLTRIFQAALKRASSTDGSGRVSVPAEGPTPARRARQL